MVEPRKASEILLDLEIEVRKLKTTVELQDHLLKMILDNCNKTNTMINVLIDVQPLSQEQRLAIKEQFQSKETIKAISIQPGFPIEVEQEFKGQRRITRGQEATNTKASNANIEFKDYMANRKKVPEESISSKEQNIKSEKRVPVTQRVQDNNKKDLFMAEVNLTSNDGQYTSKTKTNAMGKWQAQLPPGKYLVKVSKMDTTLQKKLESQQEITVPNSNSPVILSTLIINRA